MLVASIILLSTVAAAEPETLPVAIDGMSWITAEDYPVAALREGRFGVSAVELKVGTDGRVSDCSVAQSSGSVDLDETTCRLLTERARFEPARDGRGRAVTGIYYRRVRWELPDTLPILEPAPGHMFAGGAIIRVRIAGDGQVAECMVLDAGNSSSPQRAQGESEICAQVRAEHAAHPPSGPVESHWVEYRQIRYVYRTDPRWPTPTEPVRPAVELPDLPDGVT